MAGLTDDGFTAKTLQEIITDTGQRLVVAFGPDTRVDASSRNGQLIGAVSEGISEVWQLVQACYDSRVVDNAFGVVLDNLLGLLRVFREPATKAAGTVTIFGTDTVIIPSGSLVAASTLGGATFVTLATVTIGATVSGQVDVAVVAEEEGALTVLVGEVDTIITPIPGWDTVTNAADLEPGLAEETDPAYRARGAASLQIIGAGTDGSIFANILALGDVTDCKVTSNRTLVTVGSIPGKAFRAVVWPATADGDAIAAQVFLRQPAGIQSFGAQTRTVTDAQGIPQVVFWSWASQIEVGATVTLTVDAANYPADGDAQVTAALVAAVDALSIGDDVKYADMICAINSIAGVDSIILGMDIVGTGGTPPYVGTANIPIGNSEIGNMDSGNITVAS